MEEECDPMPWGFSIGSRGYIGTGYDGSFYNDFWEYNGSASGPSSGTLQFSSATYGVNESGTSVLITATRTGGSGGSVGVSYATSNGTCHCRLRLLPPRAGP